MPNVNPFEKCPIYETEHFLLRKLELKDAGELFECYSDPQAARFFNGDNCGDSFYYEDYNSFQKCVEYWIEAYRIRDFVRWTIIHKADGKMAGTAEVCPSLKYACDNRKIGILRIDLRSEYETDSALSQLYNVMALNLYKDFQVYSILTKIWPDASKRRKSADTLGFEPVTDQCRIPFPDYFIRFTENR